ncbi:MAG: MCE family protein [Verrucomicrobia bacterium]|nr:MCE family protein [Verrucomicrobiota bacterium]
MQIIRNEVRTGLLVLLTLGLAVGVVLYLSAPGLFRPLHFYRVYFDNAAGIKPGATVMLAGRKIGTVRSIQSPVPLNERPPGHPTYEAVVTVEVASDSQIYKETNVTMRTFGLLADLVIDFTNGDPLSGLAQPNDSFVGGRAPDLGELGPQIIQRLNPALTQAESTLAELQRAASNLTNLMADDSPLVGTIKNFDAIGNNLKGMTGAGGAIDTSLSKLQDTLTNVQNATAQLDKDNNLEKTLANFNASSERLRSVLGELHGTLGTALPRLNTIVTDFSELSGRLKTQPWRLVWPSTIKYDQPAEQTAPVPPRRRARERE